MEAATRNRVVRLESAPAVERVERRFLLGKANGRKGAFEVRLAKTFFNVDQEDIRIRITVNNFSNSKISSVSVNILEVLGESSLCREMVKRGAGGVGEISFAADSNKTGGQEEEKKTMSEEEKEEGTEKEEQQDEKGKTKEKEGDGEKGSESLPQDHKRKDSWLELGLAHLDHMKTKKGAKRVYPLELRAGEQVRDVELSYPLRSVDIQGESLFYSLSFRQTYYLIVTFHMSFGTVNPRVRIPIVLLASSNLPT